MSHHPARSRWVLPSGIAVAILLASLVPLPEGSMAPVVVPLGITTWLHAVGYAALAAGLVRALLMSGRTGGATVAVAVIAAVGFGIGIELLQTVVPTRSFAWSDVGADAIGSAIGGVGWWRSRRRFTAPGDSRLQ